VYYRICYGGQLCCPQAPPATTSTREYTRGNNSGALDALTQPYDSVTVKMSHTYVTAHVRVSGRMRLRAKITISQFDRDGRVSIRYVI